MRHTKYQEIVDSLKEKIQRGAYKPNAKLPGVVGLSREYKVSQITSNRALSELQRMGLVERRERLGTFVVQQPSKLTDIFIIVNPTFKKNLHLFNYWQGIVSQAEKQRVSIHTVQIGDPRFAEKVTTDYFFGQGFIFLELQQYTLTQALKRNGIPFLYLGVYYETDDYYVNENRQGAARALVGTLIDSGYRRIGFIGDLAAPNHREARDGYLEGIKSLKLGYGLIRDADDDNVVEIVQELVREPFSVDALIIMGSHLPIAALPVLAVKANSPALGFLSEEESIFSFGSYAYIGYYNQISTGKLAVDVLTELTAPEKPARRIYYPPFQILKPGEKPDRIESNRRMF